MEAIAQFLQTYGGWAVSIILGIVFVKFYKDFKKTVEKKDVEIKQLNESHLKEMVDVVRECTQVITSVDGTLETFNRNQGTKDASHD